MFTNPQTQWVDRFLTKLGSLAADGAAERYRDLAYELYPDLNTLPPEHVAQIEWGESVRHDH